jgi:hypothetical protein
MSNISRQQLKQVLRTSSFDLLLLLLLLLLFGVA